MRRIPGRADEGATLVETLVSLVVVMVAMGGVGAFLVNSFASVAQQRTYQNAAQLANNAINQVRALRGSALVTGRGFAKTDAQWCSVPFPPPGGDTSQLPPGVAARAASCAANAATPYLQGLQEVWDPLITSTTSALGDDAALPTATQTMTVDGVAFSRTIYVGACDIYTSGTGKCVNTTVVTPPADSTKDLQFYRAVVLIGWAARSCPGGCSYVASTLMSRASEPVFDFHRPSPVIKTTAATFYKGTSTTFQLSASGGQLPNAWTAAPLPTGLTVTPAGVVSGTPTTLGTTTSTVKVTDSLGRTDSETVTFTVVAPLALTVPAAKVSHVGDAVSLTAAATGGVTPYTFSATGLPPGLDVNATTGAITGTLTTAATYTPSITVADANTTFDNPATATGSYSHVVYPAVVLASIADQSVALGSAVNATAAGSGGYGTLTYSATGLPLGVSINSSTGVISGVATVSGRYLPTVTVTDAASGSAAQRFTLIVSTATGLFFTSPSLTAADQTSSVGKPANVKLGNNGNALGLSPVMTVSGLPPGLSLNPVSGVVNGTPTTAGTYTVTAVATNALPPQTSVLTFLWTVS